MPTKTKSCGQDAQLFGGDCLEVMPKLLSGSIDMVLVDPPYGTTDCKWDSIIPLEPMWRQLNRITRANGAIVMTASQPFTTTLISSNMKRFKCHWIYHKACASNFGTARYMPMKEHEDIVVFSNGDGKLPYNPIMQERRGSGKSRIKYKVIANTKTACYENGNLANKVKLKTQDLRYPSSVQQFNNRAKGDRGLHPSQKPVALMEYLIRTYTDNGDTVLDFAMGSGTTGVACKRLGRRFVGIELNEDYFEIARKRIEEVLPVNLTGGKTSDNQ